MTSKYERDNNYAAQMRKAQSGDKVAYESLLKKIIPLLEGFIYNKLGKRPDNEDILQEILIAIHRSAHTYNTERSFTNWMFAIANHKVLDFLRKSYHKNSLIEVDFDEVQDFLTDNVTNDVSKNESLVELLDDLPGKQREILHLMKIEGYSVKEISTIMKMNVSAVKVAAHRAYKTLIRNKNKIDS